MLCGSVKLCMIKVITLAKAETMARKNAFYKERHKFFTHKKLQQGSKESLMIATCKTTSIVRK